MDLENDGIFWYISFILHASMIEKDWIDAMFLQELRHNTWVVIPSYVLNNLAQKCEDGSQE